MKKTHIILLEKGYKSWEEQNLSKKQRQYFLTHGKDLIYFHKKKNILLELHYKLTPSENLFPLSFGQAWRTQKNNFLSINHLWLYQSYHGFRSGWYRLHWLTDLYFLYNNRDINWKVIIKEAKKSNCLTPLTEALLLLEKIFQVKLPKELQVSREEKKTNALFNHSLRLLLNNKIPNSTHRIIRYNWAYGPKVSLKTYFFENGISKKDCSSFSLPDILFPIYYSIRPLLYIKNKLL